jgi:short subunit dehydrogenase-like uncharacterized protein
LKAGKGFLLYGATGYTGALTARAAVQQGLRPLLAGRNREKVEALAGELRLPWRAFGLDDRPALHSALGEVAVVLHCAGPYSLTYPPMVEACLQTGTHYLDLTGEMAEHEDLAARDEEAKAAGVMLLPSAGFDVVPSDCLAVHVARRLPSATHLALAFSSAGGWSRGTMISSVEAAAHPGIVRKAGKLTRVPAAYRSREIDFGHGPVSCVTIPWGDLATAYTSTGIPNIETYIALPGALQRVLRGADTVAPLATSDLGQRLLKGLVGLLPAGPDEKARAQGYAHLWAEASDEAGRRVVSRMRTPHSYTLTALTGLDLVRRVLAGEVHPGYQTPAKAYGPELVMNIAGVTRWDE